MNEEYIRHLVKADLSSAYSFKILLLLNLKPYTQAQICVELGMHKGNLTRYIRELERLNLIEVDRIEGRNKFYKATTDMKKIHEVVPGQTKLL